jgi:hypothetical protein
MFQNSLLTETGTKKEESVDDGEGDEEEERAGTAAMNETTSKRRQLPKSAAEAKEWDKQVNSTNGWMMSLQNHLIYRDVTLRSLPTVNSG